MQQHSDRRGFGARLGLAAAALVVIVVLLRQLLPHLDSASGPATRSRAAGAAVENAITIHLLGSSTALGDPYTPRANLGRIAAILLGDSLAGRPLVVDNRGGKGKPAAAAVQDAREIARARPKPGSAVALLYLGNNEFLGFDRRHDLRRSERQLFDVPVVGVPELQEVLKRYRASIETIVRVLQEAGVRVIAMTAAVNLADWEPNRSVLANPGHADEVRTLLATGDRSRAAGELRAALEAYRQALALEPGFALAHKHAGDCELRLGDVPSARRAYQAAVDGDGNPYRELSSQNAILREVCAAYQVPVIDSQALLDAASPAGITGFDLMWDNCHPTLDGYITLAHAGAESLRAAFGDESEPLANLDRRAVERVLGIDAAFQRSVLHERGKYCYVAATLTFDPRARLERAHTYLDQAARLGPEDADITCSQAILAALEDQVDRSLELWRQAYRLDAAIARDRMSNRYVVQIMRGRGVEDLETRVRDD